MRKFHANISRSAENGMLIDITKIPPTTATLRRIQDAAWSEADNFQRMGIAVHVCGALWVVVALAMAISMWAGETTNGLAMVGGYLASMAGLILAWFMTAIGVMKLMKKADGPIQRTLESIDVRVGLVSAMVVVLLVVGEVAGLLAGGRDLEWKWHVLAFMAGVWLAGGEILHRVAVAHYERFLHEGVKATPLDPDIYPEKCAAFARWSEEYDVVRAYRAKLDALGRGPVLGEYEAAERWMGQVWYGAQNHRPRKD